MSSFFWIRAAWKPVWEKVSKADIANAEITWGQDDGADELKQAAEIFFFFPRPQRTPRSNPALFVVGI